MRIFEDQAGLFAYFPFSTTKRIEWSGSYSQYYYRIDRFNNYYYQGWYIGENREKLDAPDGYGLWRNSVAFVGDNSYFGIASPLKGHRFRFDVTQFGGLLNYRTVLADFRQYYYFKPIGLAFRGYFYGRYGNDASSERLSPLFLGYPSLVRGYNNISFGATNNANLLGINDLYGNKMLVGNVEIRLPFTGPERVSVMKSKIFFTELSLFVDAGTIWDIAILTGESTGEQLVKPFDKYIISSGASMRVNLFGQIILEPYYAIPWNRTDLGNKKGVFGLNFIPGW